MSVNIHIYYRALTFFQTYPSITRSIILSGLWHPVKIASPGSTKKSILPGLFFWFCRLHNTSTWGDEERARWQFSLDRVNLAELSGRTHISRSKLRSARKHGFVIMPNGNKGRKKEKTVLTGYTAIIDTHLSGGITNSILWSHRPTLWERRPTHHYLYQQ